VADLFRLSILAATLGLGVSAAQGEQHDRPVLLTTETSDAGVALRVIGDSDEAIDVRYTLEVEGGTGNHSTQSGTARLQPGREAVLATVQLGPRSIESWHATLRVETGAGASYTLTYPS